MNLKEFDEFKLRDAVKFHDKLNPYFFDEDGHMWPEVRKRLLDISQDFQDHLGIDDLEIKDITLSGSNAAYTYTPHSDVDLHLLVDIGALENDDVYRELFNSKKVVYNDTHDIKIHGYDVELYVQDSKQPHVSLGEYSVLNDKWIKFPSKRKANFDEHGAREKFIKLIQLSELALRSNDLDKVQNLLDMIKKYRQAGLDRHGEFGAENLAFKALRSRGIIEKLIHHRDKLHSISLSMDEDYDPNGPPPGPEFKPTMPKGTVRVDVSDVYDWYKLGQHISNLKGLGKHDFGKGPPSTIMAFGDEDTEHKYIGDLEKTGLSTTDIDPVDPNQPKGMKRQKVDPTFNVDEETLEEKWSREYKKSINCSSPKGFSQKAHCAARRARQAGRKTKSKSVSEGASGYIPSNAEKDDPRFKTGLTVDVHPDSIQKNAQKLGLGKIKRAGIPPTARTDGKLK